MYIIFQSPSDGTDYEGLRLNVIFSATSSNVSFNVVIHVNQAHSCPVDFFLDLEIPSTVSAMGVVKASPGNAMVLIADEHSGECSVPAVYLYGNTPQYAALYFVQTNVNENTGFLLI